MKMFVEIKKQNADENVFKFKKSAKTIESDYCKTS